GVCSDLWARREGRGRHPPRPEAIRIRTVDLDEPDGRPEGAGLVRLGHALLSSAPRDGMRPARDACYPPPSAAPPHAACPPNDARPAAVAAAHAEVPSRERAPGDRARPAPYRPARDHAGRYGE